jgi:SAM-dependent methyltransferase
VSSPDLREPRGESDGERVLLRGRPRTHNDQAHLARYEWAAAQLSGRVLDVACGTGYGAALLSRRCEVTGIDNSEDALRHARSTARSARFIRHELPLIPFADASFDGVVSFETVEHIPDDRAFLAEVRRVLRPGGLFLLSTPNKEVTSPAGPPENPFHVREYRLQDLNQLTREAGFDRVEALGQGQVPNRPLNRFALRVVARFPWLCRPGRWWDALAHGRGEVRPPSFGPPPTIWVLRCS